MNNLTNTALLSLLFIRRWVIRLKLLMNLSSLHLSLAFSVPDLTSDWRTIVFIGFFSPHWLKFSMSLFRDIQFVSFFVNEIKRHLGFLKVGFVLLGNSYRFSENSWSQTEIVVSAASRGRKGSNSEPLKIPVFWFVPLGKCISSMFLQYVYENFQFNLF